MAPGDALRGEPLRELVEEGTDLVARQRAGDRLGGGPAVEDHQQQRDLRDLHRLGDRRRCVDVDQAGQEPAVVPIDGGRDVLRHRGALGRAARRVEHQHHRRGDRGVEDALEALLGHVEGVRRACGRAARRPGATRRRGTRAARGRTSGRRLAEAREVDRAGSAERLLRHAVNPREGPRAGGGDPARPPPRAAPRGRSGALRCRSAAGPARAGRSRRSPPCPAR